MNKDYYYYYYYYYYIYSFWNLGACITSLSYTHRITFVGRFKCIGRRREALGDLV